MFRILSLDGGGVKGVIEHFLDDPRKLRSHRMTI